MHRSLGLLTVVIGTFSPSDDEFLFDFQNTETPVNPTTDPYSAIRGTDGYLWPTSLDLSEEELAWLDIGFGQDQFLATEDLLMESAELFAEEPSNAQVDTVPSVFVPQVSAAASVGSPSKRPRGRPPKASPAKSSTTSKPKRGFGHSSRDSQSSTNAV